MNSKNNTREKKRVEVSWKKDETVRVKRLKGDVGVKEAVKLSSAVAGWLEYDEEEGLKVLT